MASSFQTTPAIEAFLKDLQQYVIGGTRGSECAQFIPPAQLRACLRQHARDLLQDLSPDQLHREHYIINSYAQVFAILIGIGEGAAISHFIACEMLSDRRLPFVDNYGFPLGKDFFEKFQQRQWMFCAPTLTRHFEWTFDQLRILPFQREKDPMASGNSGVIYKISVPYEYDALSGIPVEEDHNSLDSRTTRILKTFRDKKEFLKEKAACTTLIQSRRSPPHIVEYLGSYEQGDVRCIILEYADIGTLDEYFERIAPPRSEDDLVAFFTGLFELIKGLNSIHEVGERLIGWHHDLKPANILAFSQLGKTKYEPVFKISDLGTSNFKTKQSGTTTLGSASFGRTYAPPECWRNEDEYLQSCDLQVTQKVDIWALGCIFIEAMVWVTGGWSLLDEFRRQRLFATNKIEGFKDGNCFHDGEFRLPIVDDWLDRVVSEGPRSDHVSPLLIHLAKEMVDETVAHRLDCPKLWLRTRSLLGGVEKKRNKRQSHNLVIPLPPPESPRGQPSADPRFARQGSQSQPSSNFHSPKSPTFSISRDPTPPSSSSNASPSASDGYDWRSPQEDGHLASSETLENHTFLDESPSPRGLNGAHRPSDNTTLISLSIRAVIRASHSNTQPRLDTTNSIGPCSFSRGFTTRQTLTACGNVMGNGAGKTKAIVPLWPLIQAFLWKEQRKEPKRISLSKISRYIGKETEKSKFANIPGSEHLLELKDRDHIIVIDDSSSMIGHKLEVSKMADLLVYALKGFDSDGIDMHLTVARTKRTITNSSQLSRFLAKSSFMGQCNMAHCLGQIFEAYKEKISKKAKDLKPASIYVLTDAIWQPKCEVDTQITDFVKFLVNEGQWSRQVGIQFIRFGNKESSRLILEALDTLKQNGFTARDIIDQEHYDGNFFKMLLGAINPLFDDDDDDDDECDRSSGKSHQSFSGNHGLYGGNNTRLSNGLLHEHSATG